MGLRERRRRETSADIRGAAVRLARERGFDRVTIDEICAEAGISSRTFFNYFPNKESAVAYGPSDIPPELVEEFVAAGPAPYSVVLDELITLAAHHLRDMPPDREQAETMLELAKTTPAILAAFLADLERFQNHLIDIVARRQAMRPDDEIPARDLRAGLDGHPVGHRALDRRQARGCRRHTDAVRRARRRAGQQHFRRVI